MSQSNHYGIGTPGDKWSALHISQWLSQQTVKRSFNEEVEEKLITIPQGFKKYLYGKLKYEKEFQLTAFVPEHIKPEFPNILITGGVHGYETSGVQGAIKFLREDASKYLEKANLFIIPCVSPWGYETINRWNPQAIDPNRSFGNEAAQESKLLKQYIHSMELKWDMHIDLHETTDTDNSEFRPALAARDGTEYPLWEIPDGFYVVGDTANPQHDFQKAIIDAVARVTHIAPADENNCIIGAPITQRGVISYDLAPLGLCASLTNAPYVSTTEVYPDSPKVDEDNCNDAQVAAIVSAIEFVLGIK